MPGTAFEVLLCLECAVCDMHAMEESIKLDVAVQLFVKTYVVEIISYNKGLFLPIL